MKRLIIAEEEKKRILGLYNRFLINEQDDIIDLNDVFKTKDGETICSEMFKEIETKSFGENVYKIESTCYNFTSNIDIEVIINSYGYSFIKYTKRFKSEKTTKEELNPFLDLIKLLNQKLYDFFDEKLQKIIETFKTTKYMFTIIIHDINYDNSFESFIYKHKDYDNEPKEILLLNIKDNNVFIEKDKVNPIYTYEIKDGEFIFTPISSTETKNETSTETKDKNSTETKDKNSTETKDKNSTENKDKKSSESSTTSEIKKDFDRMYNYKKDGNDYFFQLKSEAKKNPDNWTKAEGTAKTAIAFKVFKDKEACKFPSKACDGYDGKKWSDSNNKDNTDKDTKIGFCSTKYCAVKYIQDGINTIIDNSKTIGHSKLKNMPLLMVDGKFGTETENYIYKLNNTLYITPNQVKDLTKEV